MRLTQQPGVSSAGGTTANAAIESCELHPISGYVLCFCKEVVAFETVYQDLLEIAVRARFHYTTLSTRHLLVLSNWRFGLRIGGVMCVGRNQLSHWPSASIHSGHGVLSIGRLLTHRCRHLLSYFLLSLLEQDGLVMRLQDRKNSTILRSSSSSSHASHQKSVFLVSGCVEYFLLLL